MATTKFVETLPCMECHKTTILTLDSESYTKYLSGMHIQDAFPNWTPDQRELLITGTHPECWNKIFPDEGEE